MIAELLVLLPIAQSALWAGFVVFLRVAAMMSLFPAFGEQSVPVRLRLAIALAFVLIVTPVLSVQTGPIPSDILPAIVLLFPEVLTGLFFGLLLRFFVFALQIAGTIAAQSTSLSQIFGGSAGVDPQPAMGHVLVVSGLALAAMMGLHVQLTAYILQSYALVPLGVWLMPDVAVDLGVRAVGKTFALGFTLAAPFLIASLIYNVTLGVINRAMPQLMVSFVGAPAITAGGLLLLVLTAPLMLSIWLEAFALVVMNPAGGWE
ncbi:flagellar biosynthetic protein FliR [Yoonia sp. R2331]|uniref:flagellar biosynthetic protein FliR n=1 Tax=Yoonia sp. R2331 TaxID=3237238 RepID=UPI0034E58700